MGEGVALRGWGWVATVLILSKTAAVAAAAVAVAADADAAANQIHLWWVPTWLQRYPEKTGRECG